MNEQTSPLFPVIHATDNQVPPHAYQQSSDLRRTSCTQRIQFPHTNGTVTCGYYRDDDVHRPVMLEKAEEKAEDVAELPIGKDHPAFAAAKANADFRATAGMGDERPAFDYLLGMYPEVRQFAELMLLELWANRTKGNQEGWRQDSPRELWNEVQWHSAKLAVALQEREVWRRSPLPSTIGKDRIDEAFHDDRVREYAADTANMAMMVLDTMGLLPMPPGEAARTPQNTLWWLLADDNTGEVPDWSVMHTVRDGAGNLWGAFPEAEMASAFHTLVSMGTEYTLYVTEEKRA